MADAYFAQGCFWGAEKLYWETPGVIATEVGYMGGTLPNPTYEQVCTGATRHAETVHITFDPHQISYAELVKIFLENHNPTQLDKQGNDIGTQYRSEIFIVSEEQGTIATEIIESYQDKLTDSGYGMIRTRIEDAPHFWRAEENHQRYLEKVPNGYCPIHATGVQL